MPERVVAVLEDRLLRHDLSFVVTVFVHGKLSSPKALSIRLYQLFITWEDRIRTELPERREDKSTTSENFLVY